MSVIILSAENVGPCVRGTMPVNMWWVFIHYYSTVTWRNNEFFYLFSSLLMSAVGASRWPTPTRKQKPTMLARKVGPCG